MPIIHVTQKVIHVEDISESPPAPAAEPDHHYIDHKDMLPSAGPLMSADAGDSNSAMHTEDSVDSKSTTRCDNRDCNAYFFVLYGSCEKYFNFILILFQRSSLLSSCV